MDPYVMLKMHEDKDKFKGVYVQLEESYSEDDLKYILHAIRMIKGVRQVTTAISDWDEYLIFSRGKEVEYEG